MYLSGRVELRTGNYPTRHMGHVNVATMWTHVQTKRVLWAGKEFMHTNLGMPVD